MLLFTFSRQRLRSLGTILAVDNFTGVSFAGTTIRVDHKFYTPPKKRKQRDEDDSSEEEKQDLLVEEKKALQDVRWDNETYRSKAFAPEPAEEEKKGRSKDEKDRKKGCREVRGNKSSPDSDEVQGKKVPPC